MKAATLFVILLVLISFVATTSTGSLKGKTSKTTISSEKVKSAVRKTKSATNKAYCGICEG